MLRVLKRNPLQWISLHQITQSQLPFLPQNLTTNRAAADPQINIKNPIIPHNFYSFSTASSSNSPQEPIETKDPIFDFLRSYGFTDAQIEKLINKCPLVRFTETIKPKLDHLLAFGFSPSDLTNMICYFPGLLDYSQNERIEPNLSLLEATFGSKMYVIKGVKRSPWLLTTHLEKHVIPNLDILRESGIPMEKIISLFLRYPHLLGKNPNFIAETIAKLKGFGMNPKSLTFIHGINAIASFKEEVWESKVRLYESFGWSEQETVSVFAREPTCLQLSDEKIKEQMEFFMDKLHWEPSIVLKYPNVLMYNLEKRIIPRCSVLNVLAKSGLWIGKPTMDVFKMHDNAFRWKFVSKFGKKAPLVFDAYQGKVEFNGFEPSIVPNGNQSETCVGD